MLSVREFRANLAAALARAGEGETLLVGPHRRAEVVVMSVEEYQALAQQANAVTSAVASVRAEGLEPTPEGIATAERIVAGELTADEAVAELHARHRR